MQKEIVYLLTLAIGCLITSCSKETEINKPEPTTQQVSFVPSINPLSRSTSVNSGTKATASNFDTGDAIGVFAVEKTAANSTGQLMTKNYADNSKYNYSGTLFESTTPITYPANENPLFFHAVYPYLTSLAATFTFEVKKDQNAGTQYTQSDLMTAVTEATTELTPVLKFNHRLSNIIVNLTFEQAPTSEVNVSCKNVKRSVTANLNTNTYEGTGNTDIVLAAGNGTNSFKTILPPQIIDEGTEVIIIDVGSKQYSLVAIANITWKSGIQYEYGVTITKEGEVQFTSTINPWGNPTDIEEVVPPEILEEMKPHITIYPGNTPPNIENTYFIDPMVTVYCQDEDNGGFAKGTMVTSEYIKFTNQNNAAKTIEFSEKTVSGSSSSTGTGAFISGSGNNFTVYLNTEGTSSGIYVKQALVISGTKASTGIKDLRYAFVLVEKGADPENKLMKEGVFRVFEDGDGVALISTWPADVKSLQEEPKSRNSEYNIFSFKSER